MAKYYVNQFSPGNTLENQGIKELPYGKNYIGLFTGNEWRGSGTFCGWYGVEWYLNTKLVAYYTSESRGIYDPHAKTGDVVSCNIALESVIIGSVFWEQVLEADSLEEAIEKFANGDFKKEKRI